MEQAKSIKESITINLDKKIEDGEITCVTSYNIINKYKTSNNKYFYLIKKGKNLYDYFEYDDSFEIVGDFYDNRCLINKNGKYGYIDENFNIVIEPQYVEAKDFSEEYAIFKENGKYGAIDINGCVTIKPEYDTFDSFNEGYAVVSQKGLYGYITTEGKILGNKLSFTSCTPFDHSRAKICINSNVEYVQCFDGGLTKDDFQKEFENGKIITKAFSNKYFLLYKVRSRKGDSYCQLFQRCSFFDREIYDFVEPYEDKMFIKYFDVSKYYDLLIGENSTIKTEYNLIIFINDKYYIARDNSGKYGIIDIDLNVLVPIIYSEKEIKELLNSNKMSTINDTTYIFSQGKIKEYSDGNVTINVEKNTIENCLLLDNKKDNERILLEKEILGYLSKLNSSKLNETFEQLNSQYKSKYDILIAKEIEKRNNNKQFGLTFEKEEKISDVYTGYIKELKRFLEMLKEKQNLIDVINEIEKCINFVEFGEASTDDAFYKDVNTLLSLYKSLDKEFLVKNKNRFIGRLKEDLDSISKFVNEDDDTELNFDDVKSWKLHFRNKLELIINEFKNDYDMQEFKHTIENKELIIKSLKGNKYNWWLYEYNYIINALNNIKNTISLYENKYQLDFSKVKEKLKLFENINIDYSEPQEVVSAKILSLLQDIINIETEVSELTKPYSYEITSVSK